jgi:outer membrane protein assembly factor BamA
VFARLLSTCILLYSLHAACASAEEQPQPPSEAAPQPPPDPMRGERSDGKIVHGDGDRDALLAVPRLVLLPVRLVWMGLSVPAKAFGDGEEKYHVSKVVYRMFTSEDGKIGVRPQFSYIASFSPVFGVSVFDRKLFGPDTYFGGHLEFGLNTYNLWSVSLSARPLPGTLASQLQLTTSFVRRDDQLFTGIGNGSDQPASRSMVIAFDLSAVYHFVAVPWVHLDAGIDFGLRRFENGRMIGNDQPIFDVYCVRMVTGQCAGVSDDAHVDEKQVPGFNQGTQFLRPMLGLTVDTRDNPFRPSSGGVLQLFGDYSLGLGDETSYFRVGGSLTGVIDLWRRSHVLLLRAWGETVIPTGSTPVPFSELVVIGGPDDLRGVRWGKFRDNSGVLFTAEYRWPLWMWMDADVFTDAGGVFGTGWSGFRVEELHPDVGFGVRLRTSKLFLFRLQTAWSPSDGWQFFFSARTVP